MEMESPSTVDRDVDEELQEESQDSSRNSLSPGGDRVSPQFLDVASSSSSSSSDFLPIKTEIKKMGVEISDERAEQLKNDVRRLSPEVVSLRERTLGEISLTPDSSFFEVDEETEKDEKTTEESSRLQGEPNRLEPLECGKVPISDFPENLASELRNEECGASADVLFLGDDRTVEKLEGINPKCGEVDPLQEFPTPSASSARAVIQKLEENEEIVFVGVDVAHVQLQASSSSCSSSSSFSSSSSSSSPTTNPLNFMIAYPETSPCSSTESADQDPLGDHGEIEGTDSDCSEQTTALVARGEDQVNLADIQNQDSTGTGEMILSRERIQPEQFTEDSAESLALATGNRDEVRSDGSDSGLGGEIVGDNGVNQNEENTPESDSETSFLDRIPDDILSDKDKNGSSQLDGFPAVPGDADTLESCQIQRPTPILPALRSPPKSNLKRRLTDCMEGEPNPKRSNSEESQKKKRNIHFDAVTVYYFPRAQGFTCVPSQGGSTLGMSAAHTHAERFSLTEHAAEQRRLHRARLAQLRSERAANNVVEAASSSEDPSDDTDEEPSDAEELDIDSYYFLLPVPTWQRRALLRAAGVQKIDTVEKDECRDIRASRKHCGCGCKGYCDPESCPCSRAHVKCQVDRAGFPCGCSRDGCANSSGRIEFNPVRVRTHFIHTLMRLELEKKHREVREEDCPDLRDLDPQSSLQGPLRDARGLPPASGTDPTCSINGSGFTTLHYPTQQDVASCQPDIPRTREDSLDLYAIRDDCYPTSEDAADGVVVAQNQAHQHQHQHHHQRKLLHPNEFGQNFHQGFSSTVNNPSGVVQQQQFQQNNYQDYQAYQQTLPSTSRGQFHEQFQQQPPHHHTNNHQGFSHYAGYVGDSNVMAVCHQPGNMYDGNNYPHDEGGSPSQYTNLSSVQPLITNNSVIHSHQQIGKLEPFSELLSGRYSYYGDVETPQNHVVYPDTGGGAKNEEGQAHGNDKIIPKGIGNGNENQENATLLSGQNGPASGGNDPDADGKVDAVFATETQCDENFGEIIKKSMVETVSA